MSFNVKVRRQNKQAVIDLRKKFKKKKKYVEVGLLGNKKHEDSELTVAEVGFYNEFGTEKIPERSFMRRTIIEKKKAIKASITKLSKLIVEKKLDEKQALGLLGEQTSGFIKKTIIAVKSPIESPQTLLKKKGVSNPLIDTSQMLNSITWKIENGS